MADPAATSPPRISRYRSQRRAQAAAAVSGDAPEVPAIPEDDSAPEDAVARARSRYRKKGGVDANRPATARPATTNPGPETARAENARPETARNAPPMPTAQSPPRDVWPPTANGVQRQRTESVNQRARCNGSPQARAGAPSASDEQVDADGYGSAPRARPQTARSVSETSGLPRVKPVPQPVSELYPPLRTEPAPAPQPVVLDGPPKSDQIKATKSMDHLVKHLSEEDEEERGGCFGLFKRKRPDADAEKQLPIARAPPPKTLQDAPISAVNAGDRRVLVECGDAKTVFPVTIETTPVDIIRSAASCMSERIDVRSAVLLEHFGSVGVQRPLRRYERIRDVMNSWDTDRQHSLIIVDPGTGRSEAELSLAGVPKEKPGDLHFLMSYSQKVGRWDKRAVILRPDGQVAVQKDPSKPKHIDNVCHLSDFDIYIPTSEKAKKKIKPPKRYCFAIKSQQKAAMFESTQNFVHFFCTGDKQTADEFHAAIQGWRSWYLVNVMGEGRTAPPNESPASPDRGGDGLARTHKQGASMDSHYRLGSFKPLLDGSEFEQRPTTSRRGKDAYNRSANQFKPTLPPERRTSTRRAPAPAFSSNKVLAEDEPLVNFASRVSVDQSRMSTDLRRSEEFASASLLGRTYSQRQRDLAERDSRQNQPFTDGPNLLSNGYHPNREEERHHRTSLDDAARRQQSARRENDVLATGGGDVHRNRSTRNPSSDLARSGSMRKTEMPRPLVDLKPEYREPPQHANKGRGYRPQPGSGPLVEAATSPEDFIGAPPATDWRGRNQPTHSPGLVSAAGGGHGHFRAQSRSRSSARPGTSSRSADSGEAAFTGEGLLAGSHGRSGWGSGDRGRGVQGAGKARDGKLVDLSEGSRFAGNSLLERVEREQGSRGPVIDREKRDD